MLYKNATFSPDRIYRYTLERSWHPGKGTCGFVLMNPSTADENVLDNTLRRCMGYSQRWGFGSMYIANIFAYRSTDPRGLLDIDDPVGPGNNDAILDIAERCPTVILGWGSFALLKNIVKSRRSEVRDLLQGYSNLYYLKKNKDGNPGHPLYLKDSLEPIKWEW